MCRQGGGGRRVMCVCSESEGSVREWMCEERSNNWRDGRRQREIHSVRSERGHDKLLYFSTLFAASISRSQNLLSLQVLPLTLSSSHIPATHNKSRLFLSICLSPHLSLYAADLAYIFPPLHMSLSAAALPNM